MTGRKTQKSGMVKRADACTPTSVTPPPARTPVQARRRASGLSALAPVWMPASTQDPGGVVENDNLKSLSDSTSLMVTESEEQVGGNRTGAPVTTSAELNVMSSFAAAGQTAATAAVEDGKAVVGVAVTEEIIITPFATPALSINGGASVAHNAVSKAEDRSSPLTSSASLGNPGATSTTATPFTAYPSDDTAVSAPSAAAISDVASVGHPLASTSWDRNSSPPSSSSADHHGAASIAVMPSATATAAAAAVCPAPTPAPASASAPAPANDNSYSCFADAAPGAAFKPPLYPWWPSTHEVEMAGLATKAPPLMAGADIDGYYCFADAPVGSPVTPPLYPWLLSSSQVEMAGLVTEASPLMAGAKMVVAAEALEVEGMAAVEMGPEMVAHGVDDMSPLMPIAVRKDDEASPAQGEVPELVNTVLAAKGEEYAGWAASILPENGSQPDMSEGRKPCEGGEASWWTKLKRPVGVGAGVAVVAMLVVVGASRRRR